MANSHFYPSGMKGQNIKHRNFGRKRSCYSILCTSCGHYPPMILKFLYFVIVLRHIRRNKVGFNRARVSCVAAKCIIKQQSALSNSHRCTPHEMVKCDLQRFDDKFVSIRLQPRLCPPSVLQVFIWLHLKEVKYLHFEITGVI